MAWNCDCCCFDHLPGTKRQAASLSTVNTTHMCESTISMCTETSPARQTCCISSCSPSWDRTLPVWRRGFRDKLLQHVKLNPSFAFSPCNQQEIYQIEQICVKVWKGHRLHNVPQSKGLDASWLCSRSLWRKWRMLDQRCFHNDHHHIEAKNREGPF